MTTLVETQTEQTTSTDIGVESVLHRPSVSRVQDLRDFPTVDLSALEDYVRTVSHFRRKDSSRLWVSGRALRSPDITAWSREGPELRWAKFWPFDKRSVATWVLDSGFRSMESPTATLSSDAQEWIAEVVVSGNPDLRDARRDLMAAREEAEEEGFAVPSCTAHEIAGRLLHAMYAVWPRRFEVYPTPNGSIAIDAPDGQGRSVIVLCESTGGVLCSVNMNGSYRQARYDDAGGLPDGFVREALHDLRGSSNGPKWR